MLKKVGQYSIALMVLTSIHHIYGAWRYDTPWRLHVLFISIPVIIITILLYRLVKREGSARFLFWLFWMVTLVPSLAMIGLFEGVYNHVLKNVLYFAGAGRSFFDRLFQPGLYELPNDFLFESTGTLQGVIAIPLAIYFVRMTASSMFVKKHTNRY